MMFMAGEKVSFVAFLGIASSCINVFFLQDSVAGEQIEMIVQVNAKTHIYRDNTEPLANFWRTIATADIDPTVLFMEAKNPGFGVLGNISHFKIFVAT